MRAVLVFLAGAVAGVLGTLALHGPDRAEPPAVGTSSGQTESSTEAAPGRTSGDAPARPALTGHSDGALAGQSPTADESEFLRRALMEERRRREAARIRPEDGGIEILERIVVERGDPSELFADFDRFAERVKPIAGRTARFDRPTGPGERITLRTEVPEDANVLEFGPGRFVLRTNAWLRMQAERSQLEIRGSGMTETTLVVEDQDLVFVGGILRDLRVRDLTFDGGERGSMLMDVRGKVAAIVENVRFVRWSSGGHSGALGVSGGAYLGMRNCQFLGKRMENTGQNAISLRGSSVVLCESCTFADVRHALAGQPGSTTGSRVEMKDCDFLSATIGRFAGDDGRPYFPVVLRGGSVSWGPPHLDGAKRREEWGATRVAAGVDTLAFRPDVAAHASVDDLLRVADAVRLEAGHVVFAVEQLSPARFELPARYHVSIWNERNADGRVVERDGSRYAVHPGDGPRWGPPGKQDLLRHRSLQAVTRATGLAPGRLASSIVLAPSPLPNASGGARVVLALYDARRALIEVIDAETGVVTPSPWR